MVHSQIVDNFVQKMREALARLACLFLLLEVDWRQSMLLLFKSLVLSQVERLVISREIMCSKVVFITET